jgi:hypothetical protein
MPLSCAVLPSLRMLDIPCVRHIGLNSHKGRNGDRAPVMSQKGIGLNSHKGHAGARAPIMSQKGTCQNSQKGLKGSQVDIMSAKCVIKSHPNAEGFRWALR